MAALFSPVSLWHFVYHYSTDFVALLQKVSGALGGPSLTELSHFCRHEFVSACKVLTVPELVNLNGTPESVQLLPPTSASSLQNWCNLIEWLQKNHKVYSL